MAAQQDIETELFVLEFTETFWPPYPLKKGKKDALKAFIQTRKQGHSLAKIMDGLASYRVHCSRSDPKFIKLAGGWLRDVRFEDEMPNETVFDASKPPLPHRATKLFDPKLYEHANAAKPGTLRSVAEILAEKGR